MGPFPSTFSFNFQQKEGKKRRNQFGFEATDIKGESQTYKCLFSSSK